MKILFILDHFWPHIGGVETLFTQLTQQHLQQGDEVTVLTNSDGRLKSYEVNKGVIIHRVGTGRQNWIKMIIVGSKLTQKNHYDLIHTSTYSAALPARVLSKRYQIPNQLHIHEIYGELRHQFLGLKAYCNKWFERFIVGLLPRDRYICVSRYALNAVRTHFNLLDHKLFLESNPLDHKFWKPYDPKQVEEIRTRKIKELQKLGHLNYNIGPIGLYYGRTGVEKGIQLYIQALPEIIKQHPQFHAVIIAPNHESKPNLRSKRQTSHTLQQLIKQLHLESHITWLAPVNNKQDIKDRVSTSDIAILPSLTEGFGYAMHEIAIMNKYLITTQIGGQVETLSDYNNIYWMKQVTSEEVVKGVITLLS